MGLLLPDLPSPRRLASERAVAAFALVGYGVLRFVGVEPFRVTMRLAGLTGSQWTCLAFAALGLVLVLRRRTLDTEFSSSAAANNDWAEDVPSDPRRSRSPVCLNEPI